MQDSWVASVSKWFADEKEDTGLQTAENLKFYGIASSIVSFSNEGKELFIQQPETSNAAHTGSLIRSLECLSKCCHAFNPICDQEEGDC